MLTHERNNDYTKDQNVPNGRTPNISVANFSAVCHDTNDCYTKSDYNIRGLLVQQMI